MHTSALPDPLSALWQAASAMFERMVAAIGAPRLIADQPALEREALMQMRAWLRPLEAMVRKIILIEAAALARSPEPPRPAKLNLPPLQHFAPKPAPPYPQPRPYKARFRLWPRRAQAPARIRQLGPPLLVRDIYRERARAAQARQLNMVRFMRPPEPARIAARIEALARIIVKPQAFVRRLARKLRRAPKLALQLAVARWPRSPHADPVLQNGIGRRCWSDALGLNDSS